MPSAKYAARIVKAEFPDAKIMLERGALHGKPLGSYNGNPQGKLTVTTGDGFEVASVVQAHVTEEMVPGPGLDELKASLKQYKRDCNNQAEPELPVHAPAAENAIVNTAPPALGGEPAKLPATLPTLSSHVGTFAIVSTILVAAVVSVVFSRRG